MKIFLLEYILWLYIELSDSSKSVFLFICLNIINNNIPKPYSIPAKPKINIPVDNSVISSFIAPSTKTKQYNIIHVNSE